MSLIFVNYRTQDEEATATLVERELSRVFGDENVFRAGKSIGPGSRYPQELLTAVRRCRVLLAVIGPRWLASRSADGRGALDNPDDWTRREILEAFETGAVVIPVLVGRTERLRAEDLPPQLAVLADCQYRRLDHRNADVDLARLTHDLIGLLPELPVGTGANGHSTGTSAAPDPDRAGEVPVSRPAHVVECRQRGGIGRIGGDFSGTFVSEPRGPVHTGSGHLYQVPEQRVAPRRPEGGEDTRDVSDRRQTDRQETERQRPIRDVRSAGAEW
ncbi:toll/interleukin-1 receptor domain-containing protein [Streptomyces sp. NPDC056061]|uniref:toll/interleukin-1 receptor domain-containing protein n=1 Tax=Streptomyces sp. NPDC056061 TaxID=3345700 RepID=UPI0035DF3316